MRNTTGRPIGPRKETGRDLFELHEIAVGRAIFEQIVPGKTLAYIAREPSAATCAHTAATRE